MIKATISNEDFFTIILNVLYKKWCLLPIYLMLIRIEEIVGNRCVHLVWNFIVNKISHFRFSPIWHHFPLKSKNRYFSLFELDAGLSSRISVRGTSHFVANFSHFIQRPLQNFLYLTPGSRKMQKTWRIVNFCWFLPVKNDKNEWFFSFTRFMPQREIQKILPGTLYEVWKICYKMAYLPNRYSRAKTSKLHSNGTKYLFLLFKGKSCQTGEKRI